MRHWPLRRRETVVVLLLVAPLVAGPIGQGAASSGQPDAVAARIRELQAEADQLARASSTLLTELRRLEVARQIKSQEVQKAESELAALTKSQQAMEQRLTRLTAERAATTPLVDERLVELYKRGRGGYLRLLLEADDLRQLGRMSRGVASVAELDRVRFDAHRRTLRAEQDAVNTLDSRRAAAAAARDAAVRARQALDAAVAAQNRRIEEIDQRRDLAAQYVGELQSAQGGLQSQVAAAGTATAAVPIAPFRGTLEWPVNGRLLARFGRGAADRLGASVVRNGIEISTIDNQQVRAVHAGTVSYAAPFAGFGTLVILDHGADAFSLYGHLSQALVTEGAAVARDGIIGLAGRSPAGVQSLYFELRIDGRPVDPVQWFRSSR
jgi:septal ring factor EnvC (AmiA/AmiB activator)